MKNKILIITILAICAWLPLQAQAVEHNFPAGSIIIPMDNAYQDEADGGLFEVYGLVYYLLQHKDQVCTAECIDTFSGNDLDVCLSLCPEDITLNWVINDEKTSITGADVVIEDLTLPRDEGGVTIEEVVRLSDKAFGTEALTFNGANGDSANKITYRGGVFIIDINDLDRADNEADYDDPAKDDLRAAMEIINNANWSAVEVHIAQVPFAAPIFRKMQGTPPKIALMNNTEEREGGNAEILEAYLQLAGICPDSYEIVTPLDIAGLYDTDEDGQYVIGESILISKDYDFLWAPHWTGTKDYAAASPLEEGVNATPDVDRIMTQIQNFVLSGKGVLAECASIETFEYNENGQFLSDKGFAHNGGTDNAADIVYDDVSSPYAQIGDFGGFDPEGGHLHNWRPFQSGDDGDFNFDTPPDVSGGDSVYVDGVTRFTSDNTGWDYYVGGHAYGDDRYGYVVYLGGHKYAKCDSGGTVNPENNIHSLEKIEFTKDVSNEAFTLDLKYHAVGTAAYVTKTLAFTAADVGTSTLTSSNLEIQLEDAEVDGKKIEGIKIINTSSKDIEIDYFYLQWENGNGDQEVKKVVNDTTDQVIYDEKNDGDYYSADFPDYPVDVDLDTNRRRFLRSESLGHYTDWFIDKDPTASANLGTNGCTANDSCEWTNIGGVRYVLNTLFNIKYDVTSFEYVRSAPVVADRWLYQGSFEWPSYYGHFRRYAIDQVLEGDDPVADWDSAVHIPFALDGNADSGARQVFTAKKDQDADTWSLLNFDTANIANLEVGLDVLPGNGSTEEENRVIERVRGLKWNYLDEVWEENVNKLGGIMHSAPAIIGIGNNANEPYIDSRFPSRDEVAYVGDLYGMLHAIKTSDGSEKWAYIPSNLLPKLQNNRTDPNATQDFAAVDGSPTAKDIYYDRDYDPGCVDTEELTCPRANRSWHTILICTQGYGGNHIFALDVTDPDNWEVLWEKTDTIAPGGGMGHAYRASLDRIKVPKMDLITGLEIPGEYEPRWVVFVATSYKTFAETHGGINVFTFDLKTGDKLATFSAEYEDSVNDIPGAVTTFDYDEDTFADRVFVGDMNGRLWELEAEDLSNPHGVVASGDDAGEQIPLFAAGVGNPISVSPAIIKRNGHVMVLFGTGGADWASIKLPDGTTDKYYYVYAVDATTANEVSEDDKTTNYYSFGSVAQSTWAVQLDAGEKVWSAPTISAGQLLVATAFGTMESTDPTNDLDGGGKLRLLDLNDGSSIWKNEDGTDKHLEIGKVRGSLYVSRGHAYMTDIDGNVIQVGEGRMDPDDPDYDPNYDPWERGTGNRVVLRSWRNQ